MIKGAIFDLDGVVIDSFKIQFKVYKKALLEVGIEILEEDYRKVWGQNHAELLKNISKIKNVKFNFERIYERKKQILKKMQKEIRPVKEILDLLDRLKKRYKLALVSSSPREYVKYMTIKFNLNKKFDIILDASDVRKQKPDPEIFLLAAKLWKVKPRECLVIEDSETGRKAAEKAGMHYLLI